MRTTAYDEENISVLNTDLFDKRRFKEIFKMSQALQRLALEAALPFFEALLGDIWAALYKMKPVITATNDNGLLKVNRLLMEMIMADRQFAHFRNFTKLNELASAIGTIVLAEMLNRWIDQCLEEDTKLQELANDFHIRQRQLLAERNSLDGVKNSYFDGLQGLIARNSESLIKQLDQARQEAKQMEERLNALASGLRAGDGKAELKIMPLRDQLTLAEKISSTPMIKEIADWAGRFKRIARQRQKVKQRQSTERRGIIIGNDIENLLPAELSFYTHRLTKLDFLRRFAENQTMQFEQIGHDEGKKGPIILCLDQSDSMSGFEAQSKGFALALLSIAQKQKRDACMLLFSSSCQTFKYELGRIGASDMVRLSRTYLRGGTNFTLVLTEALGIVEESRFKQADIILITDGEDQMSEMFLGSFKQKKQEMGCNVLSLVIGKTTDTIGQFSDRVIEVIDFNDEGSYTAFEL